MKNIDRVLKNLPDSPGVYQFKDKTGKVIYVGKAKNLKNRVRSYFTSRPVSPMISKMISLIDDVEIIKTDSEVESLILEMNLIKELKPRYNVNLKDDKSYPYIVITNESFPRVFPTRKKKNDGSKYFGPYTDVGSVKSSLKMLRDIFMIRTCNLNITKEAVKNRKFKVCLEYHIKKCGGPCEGFVSEESYNEMIKEVEKVLNGKTNTLVKELYEKMNKAAREEKFEEAALIRNRLHSLQVYSEKQKVVSEDMLDKDVINYVSEDDEACAVVLKIRDGRVLGMKHYLMTSVETKSPQEIIETVICKHYDENQYIPEEIHLPQSVSDTNILEDWFIKKHSKVLRLRIPQRGEKVQLLKMVEANARYMLEDMKLQRLKRNFVPDSVAALKRDLRLKKLPFRIECFDISNIQGTDTVASMVVFENGKPKKSHYRKYKIRSLPDETGKPDDFASMREVIYRRYIKYSDKDLPDDVKNNNNKDEQLPLPDLIVIDGGKGQLNSALTVLRSIGLENLNVIGLAKRLEEVYMPDSPEPQSIPKTSSGLKLLQRIRDEAHRFAVTFHRNLREKRTIKSELEDIKGIGKIRAKRLLTQFGSVGKIRELIKNNYGELEKLAGKKIADLLKQNLNV
ncbi:MAG: excinuclease ABC subunit UvrC [Ignavibacteria bacterium]|nr:excinuclease ABC subunit UvrC [Ignavibacteria bacterium]